VFGGVGRGEGIDSGWGKESKVCGLIVKGLGGREKKDVQQDRECNEGVE
jgi:hypothetical protein